MFIFRMLYRPKFNMTVLKPFSSILKKYGLYKYMQHNSSMSTGQSMSSSKLAITGLVSLPNLMISYNGNKN